MERCREVFPVPYHVPLRPPPVRDGFRGHAQAVVPSGQKFFKRVRGLDCCEKHRNDWLAFGACHNARGGTALTRGMVSSVSLIFGMIDVVQNVMLGFLVLPGPSSFALQTMPRFRPGNNHNCQHCCVAVVHWVVFLDNPATNGQYLL